MGGYSGKCVSSQEYPFYHCQSADSTLKVQGHSPAGPVLLEEEAASMEVPQPAGALCPRHPCCLLEKQQEACVARVLVDFALAASSASVRAAEGPCPQPWLPDAPAQPGAAGDP